jgi:ATP-binding cassette subfamily B protein
VDQEPPILNATMAENIRYTRPEATETEVGDAVRAAGLAPLLARLPQGLDTPVGERGRALSAGERQRIAIARALLANPTVLVLDEATAALDPEVEAQVLEGYERAMQGRTTIVITHRRELARRVNRVIVLERGRVVRQGPPEAVLAETGPLQSALASG